MRDIVGGILRFEDHYSDPRGPCPPQNIAPMLRENERVVSVETVKDAFGYAAARVWILKELR